MQVRNVLNGHKLFGMLGIDCIKRISEFSSHKGFESQAIIHPHGGPVSHVFVNLEGAVELQLPATGQGPDLVISRVGKGELFGVSPLLGLQRYTATAKAINAVDVLTIEAKPLLDLLQEDSRAGFHVITHVAQVYFHRYIGVLEHLQAVVERIPMAR